MILTRLCFLFVLTISFSTISGSPAHTEPVRADISSVRAIVAPSGKLRVGVYPGSPTSMVGNAAGETRGVTFDLGKELASRLDVAFELVTFPRLAEILEAMRIGQVDFTVTNATVARAQIVDFSKTLLSLELGFLVPAHSSIRSAEEIDPSGIRIGVAKGSTSERTLPVILKNASIVPTPSLKEAAQLIINNELDGFATNKSILFEMSDKLPGARILDGRWGVEHLAVAVPKGREQANDYVNKFVADVQKNGILLQTIERSGLRGLLKPK